jgi:DHA3 family tetracycline resistance protein-like MFS transporter
MTGRATRVYLGIEVVSTVASTLAFSIASLFRLRVAGLDDFQLVIVGSAMEAAVFLFEVPTGVVADLFSRKLSVIIGHAGMGVAFIVEGTAGSFAGSLTGQILWGIAYTFTSGATTAWIAGELGEPDSATLTALFLRVGRWGSATALVMIPAAFAFGAVSLRTPLLVAGAVQVLLALGLWIFMPETGFERATAEARSTWHRFALTARDGVRHIRASRILALLTVVIMISGAASEAYDRYEVRQIVDIVGLPALFGGSALVWLAIVSTTSAGIGIVLPSVVQRCRPAATRQRLGRWVTSLYSVHVLALLVFALTRSFALAVAMMLVIERVRSIRFKLQGSLIVPLTPRAQRATVLSAMEQADSIGQVTLGPIFGLIGRAASVPAALVTSALVMIPGLGVLRSAVRAEPQPARGTTPEATPDVVR